jgi:DNA-binding transcriptional MocR family regulator
MTGYRDIAEELVDLIHKDVLRDGDRLPSIRRATRTHRVNPGTVTRAYRDLEAQGLIESRPRSGYFVRRTRPKRLALPAQFRAGPRSTPVDVFDLVFEVFETVKRSTPVIHFGSPFLNPDLLPLAQLNRAGAAAARALRSSAILEDLSPGNPELRRLIALRYLSTGNIVSPDEIVVTCGALEAISLCLRAVTKRGDTVAIETPSFYAILQSLQWMGRRAAEITTDAQHGIDLDVLERAFKTGSIKACVVMPSFQNPVGSCMPEERRRALARLAERYKVPVIEDDAYAELYFGETRPRPIKSFDRAGWVLHCGSLSKCLAPGYRVGWAAAGRFTREVWERKVVSSFNTAAVCQDALTRFLRRGGFEQQLRHLRHSLSVRCHEMMRAVCAEFPSTSRMTRPQGGYMLWVELPESIDVMELHRRALAAGVSIAPGPIFSAQQRYQNCLRLNFGYPSTEQIRQGIHTLARLMKQPKPDGQPGLHRIRRLGFIRPKK